MNKISMAMVAVLVAGVAAPALASDEKVDGSRFDQFSAVMALRDRGVNAVAVNDNWNGKIRATVVGADGKQHFEYYYLDTLQPVVGATGAKSAVLSNVDTGLKGAPILDTHSLLED